MRRYWILLLAFVQAGCFAHRPQPALARAAEYLWSQPAEDGGWHSHTYGLLQTGQSLTPFVLEALLEIPTEIYPLPVTKVDRAIAFIRRNTQPAGTSGMALGMMDPSVPDYPNYSTALAVIALCRARRPGWEKQIAPMVQYLRAQQFTEQNGWQRQDPAYGAWGMGGIPRTPPNTGHVDLSMTRHVIAALRAAGVPSSDPVFERAGVFVDRCQNFDRTRSDDVDGGFFFSTTEFETNKAGHDGKRFRSYGTTTADGVLALLAIGRMPGDPHVAAAQQWLTSHHRDMEVPGFTGPAYHRWPRGLAFYYAAASAEAFGALQVRMGSTVVDGLMRTERVDGSWVNPENLVKEDDPLIATPFAIRALVAYQLLN
jgi:squalene-hopene/tetraprenyl-beta-curcumene cyclase